jgi:hypothetical protein|tara:strand:+ start:358 stop:528 length:171 start_codon:yes stop_codon:yes gene_type:complete
LSHGTDGWEYDVRHKASGAVKLATQQIDFYIRSREADGWNDPTQQVFDHFFGMEVT